MRHKARSESAKNTVHIAGSARGEGRGNEEVRKEASEATHGPVQEEKRGSPRRDDPLLSSVAASDRSRRKLKT